MQAKIVKTALNTMYRVESKKCEFDVATLFTLCKSVVLLVRIGRRYSKLR